MNDKFLRKAHTKLSPANLDAGLPGREHQCNEVYNFLCERLKKRTKKAKLESQQKASLANTHLNKTIFVCGVPGTGKTATVRHVISRLEQLLKRDSSNFHEFEAIYVNGQQLSAPEKIYTELLHKITNENCNPEKAQDKLERIFLHNRDENMEESPPTSKRKTPRKTKATKSPTDAYKIVIVDELDLLYNERKQSVFYSLFDWPTHSNSKMIFIAIANAMDLPERFMRGRIASRVGWNKLVFESYTSDCLEKILKVRLGDELLNQTFEKSSIAIATKRIGRTSGDARRILDTCRLAIEKAIEEECPKVTPAIIDKVGFQNIDRQRSNFVRNCSPIQLIILKGIVMEAENVGEDCVETGGVLKQVMSMMSRNSYLKNFSLDPDLYRSHLTCLAGADMIQLEKDKPLLVQRLYIKDSSVTFRALIRAEQIKV